MFVKELGFKPGVKE